MSSRFRQVMIENRGHDALILGNLWVILTTGG
jgi:hypothetical protein